MTAVAVTGFSLRRAASRWNCSEDLAAEIIAGFVAMRFVMPVSEDTFVVTDTGIEWSEALNEIVADVLEVEA